VTNVAKDPSLVERWIEDQREWQKTAMSYLDSMVKNDDFLVHLGNAMRGSLLAGKPYPTATPPPPAASAAQEAPADDRLDRVLFALHEMQGQLNDLRLTLDELRNGGKVAMARQNAVSPKAAARKAAPRKTAPRKAASRKAVRTRKTGRSRG
jgi:hypothetical protein